MGETDGEAIESETAIVSKRAQCEENQIHAVYKMISKDTKGIQRPRAEWAKGTGGRKERGKASSPNRKWTKRKKRNAAANASSKAGDAASRRTRIWKQDNTRTVVKQQPHTLDCYRTRCLVDQAGLVDGLQAGKKVRGERKTGLSAVRTGNARGIKADKK